MPDGQTQWICKKCNHEFYPKSDNIKCPKCRSNSTVPIVGQGKTPEARAIKRWKKEKLQDTLDSSWGCQFQEPEVERVVLKGYNCSLRTYGTAASLNAYRRPCNPEMCPMYQTWKLLKEK